MTPDEQMEVLTKEVRAVPELNGARDCKAGVLIRVGSGLMALGDNEVCQPMALVIAASQMARQIGDIPMANLLDAALEVLGTQEAGEMKAPHAACLLSEGDLISIAGTVGLDLADTFEVVAKALRDQLPKGPVN